MRAQDAVISRPDGVPRVRRGLFAALTAVAWSAFAWLLTPVVTLLLWAVGGATVYDEVVVRTGDVQTTILLGVGGAAVGLAVVLLTWAEVQRHRFSGRERRGRPEDVGSADVAAALGATEEVAAVLRARRVVVVHLDAAGRPVRAEAAGREGTSSGTVVPSPRVPTREAAPAPTP